ncbi:MULTISPECIES: DUF1292 domain-containing protein [Terrabacteria group]|uniref:DUF1292 domain-containing protein n=1 Tax=Bacillati TaxID=1783272 RepID=UPI00193988CA|nr:MULTISPECIES: DUF1292 domain-containing protein [Terrabacteria group]MBW9211848.1 DUF1292 domain-containing protein [Trueperella sp. zg.1013]QRG87348.1 DUF1292 domain-containing protein [Bulleidia sp. zg-1006]
MQEDRMLIQLDDGREKEVHILFTVQKDGKDYVVFEDLDNQDGTVYAYLYDENNELVALSDEDMEMMEEVIQAFSEEEYEE